MARDCQLPLRVYCNYCKVEDHAIEECPYLIAKWKSKEPQKPNVLKISVELREEPPRVAMITISGSKTHEDAANLEIVPVLEIRKAKGPNPPLDPQKERDTFMEARREFSTTSTKASTSRSYGEKRNNYDKEMVRHMPSIVHAVTEAQKNVSSVKMFLKSMLGLLKYDEAISELSNIINQYEKDPKTTTTKEPSRVKPKERPENIEDQPLIENDVKQVSE